MLCFSCSNESCRVTPLHESENSSVDAWDCCCIGSDWVGVLPMAGGLNVRHYGNRQFLKVAHYRSCLLPISYKLFVSKFGLSRRRGGRRFGLGTVDGLEILWRLCVGVDAQGNACKNRLAVNPVRESVSPTLPDDAIRCDFCKIEVVYQQDRLEFFDEYDAKFWNETNRAKPSAPMME